MFLKNKYTILYYDIVNNAANIRIKGNTQRHHIVPESIGGSNDADNLVHLTHKEHFVCHHLLTKMTTGEDWVSMVRAMHCMKAKGREKSRFTEGTARAFAHNKKNYSRIASQRMKGENNPMFGTKWSDKRKADHSKKVKGNRITKEQCQKISNSKIGVKRGEFSDEWRENLSANHKSKQPGFDGSHSAETIAKIKTKAQNRAPQTREVIEAAAAKRVGSKRSEETSAKMRASWKKRKEKAKALGVTSNYFKSK